MRKLVAALIATLCMSIAAPSLAEAKLYHSKAKVSYAKRSLRGYTCGLTQRRYFGISDPKYNLALNWARFPHTSPQAGAVVVQTRKGRALGGGRGGHVSRIVSVTGQCTAVVLDSRGRPYSRNICRNLVAYVMPRGISQPHHYQQLAFADFRRSEGNN